MSGRNHNEVLEEYHQLQQRIVEVEAELKQQSIDDEQQSESKNPDQPSPSPQLPPIESKEREEKHQTVVVPSISTDNSEVITNPVAEQEHQQRQKRQSPASHRNKFAPQSVQTGFKNAMSAYQFSGNEFTDLNLYLSQASRVYKSTLLRELHMHRGIKFTISVQVEIDKHNVAQQKPKLFSRMYQITNKHQLDEIMKMASDKIIDKLTKWTNEGSGWTLQHIVRSYLNIFAFQPLGGSSYIELPKHIKDKRAVINVQNNDNQCFKWSVLAMLHPPARDANRVTKYQPYAHELNFTGISFPVSLQDIPKFEKLNDISVNVYTLDDGNQRTISPLYISDVTSSVGKHVDLLTFGTGDPLDNKSHYAYIKDFNRLMCNQTDQKTWYCRRCLHRFWVKAKYDEHITRDCKDMNAVKVTLPSPSKAKLEFTKYWKQLPAPFYIVFDLESILQPITSDDKTKQKRKKTQLLHKHKACGYAFTTICTYDEKLSRPVKVVRQQTSQDDIMKEFLQDLMAESRRIKNIMQGHNKTIIMTPQDKANFKNATHCHICKQTLTDKKDRVQDHCHRTGQFRGAAHNDCNVNYSYKHWKIPVIAHNLQGYDSHFIIKALDAGIKDIRCIPSSKERYMSFEFCGMRFIDSMNFLNTSLEKLTETLCDSKGHSAFTQTHKEILRTTNSTDVHERMKLLLQKGVYPYEYMDSIKRFDETSLPPKRCFYSSLSGEGITADDYQRANTVFDTFNLKNMGEYHDLYLKTDVLLLADVFENFRQLCMQMDGLDPTNYISLPGYAFDNLLKRRKDQGQRAVELFHTHQLDMYIFMENAIRGGICTISNRYAKANNPSMPPDQYDSSRPNSYIWYVDANNLYGWAMTQLLPISDFRWMNDDELKQWNDDDRYIYSLDPMGTDGYILEVDLEYPESLHDLHNDYPLAPERKVVDDSLLSPLSLQQKDELDIQTNSASSKLICSLENKTHYVLHYRNLQLYLNLGLKLKRIHRVLTFKQEAWMKDYIDYNTQQRAAATNTFEKQYFKMKNNQCFGKATENVRNRINFEPVTTSERLMKLIAKSTFKRGTPLTEGDDTDVPITVVGVELYKTTVELDKPIHAGFTILELSKVLMFDFHYNTMKAKYNDRAKLLFTDTDSLMYHVQTDDLYQDLKNDTELYQNMSNATPNGETMLTKLDCSEYPRNHILHDTMNKKIVGKFKDETHGDIITEFVGLRAKMYSFTTMNDNDTKNLIEHKKAKGIKRSIVQRRIRHQHFVDCIKPSDNIYKSHQVTVTSLQSTQHQVYTTVVKRKGLCPYDDKRYQVDGISTLAYGHYRIQ